MGALGGSVIRMNGKAEQCKWSSCTMVAFGESEVELFEVEGFQIGKK